MPSIEEIQANIIEDFTFLPQWDERYAYLIELGQKMAPLPNAYKNDENLVRSPGRQRLLDCQRFSSTIVTGLFRSTSKCRSSCRIDFF